jgi:hypothetical protein
MSRSSLRRDRGSVLIETVAVGSIAFLVVLSAISAAIDVSLAGTAASGVARRSAVHAARHGGLDSAAELAGRSATVMRDGDVIHVVVAPSVAVSHPGGIRTIDVLAGADVPLAPFRSDRG